MTRPCCPAGLRRSITLALGIAALASCSSSTSPNNGSVGSITVSPDTDSVAVGASVTLQATVMSPAGQVVSGQHVFWNTGNPSIATVSEAGVVTGVAAGQVQIAASAGGASAIATINVLPPPVSSVSVSPALDTIVRTGTVQLTATAFDAQHNPLANRTFTWSSNLPNVANVDANGFVTGVAAGSATITATSEGKPGTAIVVVIPPPAATITVNPPLNTLAIGGSVALSATAKDASGNVIPDAPVTWSSNNTAVATVSSTGLVVAIGGGTATITAQSGSASNTASVLVIPIISPSGGALSTPHRSVP
ncbi:MAG TPA: Ig-like domain-containing protein [Gemmatimonadaceae bacterium]|nr:Ig-like domain-containing protein [Gemmatimonadaceae bacterium]